MAVSFYRAWASDCTCVLCVPAHFAVVWGSLRCPYCMVCASVVVFWAQASETLKKRQRSWTWFANPQTTCVDSRDLIYCSGLGMTYCSGLCWGRNVLQLQDNEVFWMWKVRVQVYHGDLIYLRNDKGISNRVLSKNI